MPSYNNDIQSGRNKNNFFQPRQDNYFTKSIDSDKYANELPASRQDSIEQEATRFYEK